MSRKEQKADRNQSINSIRRTFKKEDTSRNSY
jgi:hypothetical protein